MSPLHVRMDYSTIAFENIKGGIGRYIVELSKNLTNIPNIVLEGSCKISRFRKKSYISSHIPNVPINYHPTLFTKFDVFHGPDFKLDYSGKGKKVVTIHDLATFHADLVDIKRIETTKKGNIQKTINRTDLDGIIVVSEFIKQEILSLFPHLKTPIFVTHLGANHLPSNILEDKDLQENNPRPYLLFVGTLDKRKNVIGTIKAFEIVASQYSDLDLVIVGGLLGFESDKVVQYVQNSRFRDRILLKHIVSEPELNLYYKNAYAFIFPSFYEGFGIPILEAMHYNLPIITSERSVMQEIAGEAALYANPKDIESIAHQISKVLDSNKLRDKLIKNGQKQKELFSWTQCANKTASVYQAITK